MVENVRFIPEYDFKHLTLTIKNQSNLLKMTRVIMKSFRELRKTDSWKEHVLGGAFVVEVTGKSGDWHVHLHIIIQSKYYDFHELLKLWMRLSPGRGVWINSIPKSKIVGYLSKYVTKTTTLDADREELNSALKGVRMFSPFGTWYSLNLLYKKPPEKCSKCDDPCIMLYGIAFEGEGYVHEKEI